MSLPIKLRQHLPQQCPQHPCTVRQHPLLSSSFFEVLLSMVLAPAAILLKKKVGEEIATLLPPPSFDGTDKPRAPFMAQSGGAR